MRIVAVHLLNDFSGSPKVLSQLAKIWRKNGFNVQLFTSGGKEGFLSNIQGVRTRHFWYHFSTNRILRLFLYAASQVLLLIRLLFFLKKSDLVYINTVLPFGAALAAKFRGGKIIYHIHETSMKPRILKEFLFFVVKKTATKVVYVSNFLAKQEELGVNSVTLYNSLEKDFIDQAHLNQKKKKGGKIVLMVCSLKAYKGVNEFVKLAEKVSEYRFNLVLNATQTEIQKYFEKISLPKNLVYYPTQSNLHPFYAEADLLLNLSRPKYWVETFGLTVLEAMEYGLPVIVPPVGGVTELVDQNENGYLIDSKNIEIISSMIRQLLSNEKVYDDFSKKSLAKSQQFSPSKFEKQSLEILSTI